MRNALKSYPGARQLGDIEVGIFNRTVTFKYIAGLADANLMARPGIARYRIEGGRAIREAPIASTRVGFMDEWLSMDDVNAARWSTPEAARVHASLVNDFKSTTFKWQSAARCEGNPVTWEITVRVEKSQRTHVFVISGSNAADLKMVRVVKTHSLSCRNVDLTGDLSAIAADLP